SDQAAPIVDIPEYTGPIGTASDQAAPIISLPEFKLKALKDQATGVQVISGATELGEASYLEIQKVDKQELLGKKYDAYNIQLKNENGQPIQAKGAVLVRLPISGTVQEFYRFNSEKDLKSQDFTIRDGMLEFLTLDLTTYAIIYRTETEAQQPSSSQVEEASPLANKNQFNGENSTNDKQLPATGEESSPLLFMASLSLALTAAFLLKGKKE
ncbi:SIALI-17 repeat-containing surface protein, partial [Streptococcus sp. CF8_St5-17]